MPRPRKCRKVCSLPKCFSFGPLDDGNKQEDTIVMTVDEYETIRLIDLNGYTQEECASQMKVARTTIQAIYNDARNKLARSLVNGNILKIEGGDVRICGGYDETCGLSCCNKKMEKETNYE